jgi:hypothetical protein
VEGNALAYAVPQLPVQRLASSLPPPPGKAFTCPLHGCTNFMSQISKLIQILDQLELQMLGLLKLWQAFEPQLHSARVRRLIEFCISPALAYLHAK